MPSTRNSHCQPLKPQVPSSSSRRARQRSADHPGDGRAGHEERHGAGALAGREPLGQVVDDAGEEARLGGAEQEAEHVEGRGVLHEGHRRRHQPPGQHDPGNPHAGADAGQHQVAGHFEQRVGHEEDARAQAVDRGAEAEVAVHVEGGEADVDPVEVGDDVEQEEEGDQAPADPGHGRHGEGYKLGHGGPSCHRAEQRPCRRRLYGRYRRRRIHGRSVVPRPAPRRPLAAARSRLHRHDPRHPGPVPGRQRRHLRGGPGRAAAAAAVPRARAAGQDLQQPIRAPAPPRPTTACPTTTTAGARPPRSRRSRVYRTSGSTIGGDGRPRPSA